MRFSLTLAFLTALLLSVVNVQAYKRAAVTDRASFSVDVTGNAGLALTTGTGNALNQVSTTANGILQIDFRRGNTGGIYGFSTARTVNGQPVAADIIRMRQVFLVTNNGGDCQDVSVYVSAGSAINLVAIYGRPTGGPYPGTQLAGANGARIAGAKVKLGTTAGTGQMQVDFWWQASSAVALPGNFAVRVSGVKSATCP